MTATRTSAHHDLDVDVDLSEEATRPDFGPRLRRLRVVNLVVGLVHAAQAGLMLWLSNDLSLPVTAAYLGDDAVRVQDPVAAEELLSVPIGPLVAVFLLLTAVDHLLVASPGVNRWYDGLLARQAGYHRWIEYSVSASLMVVLIALLVGIRDVAALIGLFGANSAMILFGLLMERHERPGRADWSAFWFGTLVGLVPWVAIAAYLLGADTVPGFVWVITGVELVLFATFAVNMALQYARVGPWRSYVFGEVGYLVTSLASKSLLAWIVFANVLRT